MNDRRSFLKSAAALVAGAGIATAGGGLGIISRQRAEAKKLDLVLPEISHDRLLRVTVGLRPHRPVGFRLEAEKLGPKKTIVHNFGHGGSGWSLSWGTGFLAANLVDETGETDCAVAGCGVVGLTAARLLQRRGKRVTIYAKALPPNVTSNNAGAGWSPTATLCDPSRITPEFKTVFEKAARISHRHFQDLIGVPGYGIHYQQTVRLREKAPEAAQTADFYGNVVHDLVSEPVQLTPEQHGFPFAYATLGNSLRFEMHTYLASMLADFARAGGKFVRREFKRMEDFDALPERVVVNSLGLGAKEVTGDEHLIPIRGQMTILAPQPEFKIGVAFEGASAAPRWDGVACGNTMIMGEWSTEPDMKEARRVIDSVSEVFTQMKKYT